MKKNQKEKRNLHKKMRVKLIHSDGKNWIECYFYPTQHDSFEEGQLWEEIILGKKK
jgi:hypothetical protein